MQQQRISFQLNASCKVLFFYTGKQTVIVVLISWRLFTRCKLLPLLGKLNFLSVWLTPKI